MMLIRGTAGLPNRNSKKIMRFWVVAEKVHSEQPKGFTRHARNTASLKSGGYSAELSTKKSVDSAINHFFP